MRMRNFAFIAALAVPGGAAEAQEVDGAACYAAINAQDWDQVIAACSEVVPALPENHPFKGEWGDQLNYAYQTRCQEASGASDWDGVIGSCAPLLESFPDAFVFRYSLGQAYLNKQDLANAAYNFAAFITQAQGSEQAGQLSQQIGIAARQGGLAYIGIGDRDSAIPLLKQAASANASDVEVQWQLGVSLYQLAQSAEAEVAFSAVNEHAPERAAAWFFNGQIAFNDKSYANAITRLARYLGAEPSGQFAANAHYMLAFSLNEEEDKDQAMSHYASFLATGGGEPAQQAQANLHLGTFALEGSDCSGAAEYYRAFLALAPEDPNAASVQEALNAIDAGNCG